MCFKTRYGSIGISHFAFKSFSEKNIWSSLLQLTVESRDLSQTEKNTVVKAKQIYIFTLK